MILKDFCRIATELNKEINVIQRADGYVAFFFDHKHGIQLLTSAVGEIRYSEKQDDLETLLKDNSYQGDVHYFESQSFTIID